MENSSNDIEKQCMQTFESIKHVDDEGREFWYARELQAVLGYVKWERFVEVIEKAKIACKNSNHNICDHFPDVGKMIKIAKTATREIQDIMLSRYACYLIAQNGDSKKQQISQAQTYFAVQTRKQELQELANTEQLKENDQRVFLRNELREHNKSLVKVASVAGVKTNQDFAIFQNYGYRGLYGGLGAKEIHAKKHLKKSQKILDHMGSTELAANLFRATQAEEKLKRDKIQGKQEANTTHFEVGQIVRETIASLGGTMPENLPTPEVSVTKIIKQDQEVISLDEETL